LECVRHGQRLLRDSFNNTVLTILPVEAVVLALLLAITFTVEQLLVAAEAFFLFAGWSAIRVAGLSRRQESEILEKMRVWAAVAFGVCERQPHHGTTLIWSHWPITHIRMPP
jgi:hypothetical protein